MQTLGGLPDTIKEHKVKITIELPDDLHKALKSDYAAQVIAEKVLGLELSASSKVAHIVLQAAQLGAAFPHAGVRKKG